MNLILLFAALGLAWLAAHLLNDWVQAHALVEFIKGEWVIQAEGWPAIWPPLAVGLLAAVVPAFALGLVVSRRLALALQEGKDKALQEAEKALSEQRQELAKKRNTLDFEIQKTVKESTAAANQRAENFSLENEKNKDTILRLQRKIEIIEKRLAGSKRARAARKEKAQLTSL